MSTVRSIIHVSLAVAMTAVLATACDSTGSTAAPAPAASDPAKCTLRQDAKPIATRFPAFGPIAATQWCAFSLYTGRADIPGPEDIQLVGRLTPTDSDKVRTIASNAGWHFHTTALPDDLPAALATTLTAAPGDWMTSEGFDTTLPYPADSARFFLNPTTRTVVFVAVNSTVFDTPATVAVP
ncbi:hypothetical protein [Streptomyces sp. H39-S7]|uniref:hypothetical protein n=1 Tax=Streptomyces sp. H39-S7 TaxID=3004357 RepID=UPI0022AF649A|nr:hypothetical protein [Streptomyces sp. H39-S7]MCZ4119790.1 hypothetical protein [Streptomyces sp. H39-S7]